MNEKREIREIIAMIASARERLEDLISQYNGQDGDVTELDEAADALSDAVEILEDAWSE